MRTTDEIIALYRERLNRISPMHKAALEVRSAYYGDITLPLPELDRNEKPLVANLLWSAGEQKSMRIASTMPNIYYPSINPGKTRQDQAARDRRLVNMAWWDIDRMTLKLGKRARHLVFYANSPVMLRPNFKDQRPTWQPRNPLTALPPEMDFGEVCPEDIIFTYAKSWAWLMKTHPDKARMFGPKGPQDGIVTVLEYQDDTDTVLIATGERADPPQYPFGNEIRTEVDVELERTPNRVGKCTAVLAGGIGLEHPRGSFDGTIGMWQAMGKMMALEAIGMQRAIWPEEWLVDDPTSDGAKIITHADPLHGITGHVTGGKLETIKPEPSVFATQIIDRLERNIRIEGGVPAELGGESTSNIRTGKRGDQILSSVLDFPLREAQEILAVSLQEENAVAIAIDKAYFPTTKSIYVSATAGQITYEANKLWENPIHWVSYSHAGVDAQGLVVELGQMVGMGMISHRSAMESHPLIEDAQGEFDRITQERIRDGLLMGLTQMAADPQMAPVVAQVMMQVKQGDNEIEDAVMQVHQAMQQMQAAQAQAQQQAQQAQAGAPGAPPGAGPEAQPGMAGAPGQANPAIQQPPASLNNLTSLLTQLKRGTRTNVPNQLGISS